MTMLSTTTRYCTRLAAAAALLLWPVAAVFAQVSARLEVSSTTIGLDDQLTLSITLSGGEAQSADQPDLSSLKGFRIVAGPSVSTQFQWINGQSSSSKTYSYVVLPQQQGDVTIGPFRIAVRGSEISTNSVQIKVVPGSAAPAAPSRRRSPLDRMPSIFDEPDVSPPSVGEEVFVAAEPDLRKAYPGQQITLTYRVYTQFSISGLELKEAPALKGFWVEDVEVPRVPTPTLVRIRGREYSVFEVKKQALFATAPGTLQIPSSTFGLGVEARSSDPFSFFRLGVPQQLFRRTAPVDVTILPFPEAGKPPGFKNLSGRFSLEAKVDKPEVKTGEAVALTLTLTGAGNFNTIGELELPRLDDLKIFSSRSNFKTDRGKDRIEGGKTWEYVLVPQGPGEYVIPPVRLAYFDPQAESYQVTSSSEIRLRASGTAADAGGLPRGSAPAQMRLTRQGEDIHFIRLATGTLEDQSRGLHTHSGYLLIVLLPAFGNLVLFFYLRRVERLASDSNWLRQRRASRESAAAMNRAAAALKAHRLEEFHSALNQAITTAVAGRLDLPGIEATRDQIRERLSEAEVPESLVASVLHILDACDVARFAPSLLQEQPSRQLFEEGRRALDQLARQFPGTPRRSRLSCWWFILLVASAGLAAQTGDQASRLYAEANRAYEQSRFEEAAQQYEQILSYGVRNASVHYNLGNAYYRAGKLGRAILHYEKALRLDPADRDAAENLAFCAAQRLDKLEEPEIPFWLAGLNWIHQLLRLNTQLLLLAMLWLLLQAGISLRLWRQEVRLRRLAGWLIVGTLLLILPLLTSSAIKIQSSQRWEAVVVVAKVDLHSGPGESQPVLVGVHEGMKMEIRDEASGWYQVVLPNGWNGWVPRQSVEVI